MAKYNVLTGEELVEGKELQSPIKQMCLNCKCMACENENYTCSNEKVMESGRKKILAAVPEGFEVETLTLKPMVLKNPTKKCPNYEVDQDVAFNALMGILG